MHSYYYNALTCNKLIHSLNLSYDDFSLNDYIFQMSWGRRKLYYMLLENILVLNNCSLTLKVDCIGPLKKPSKETRKIFLVELAGFRRTTNVITSIDRIAPMNYSKIIVAYLYKLGSWESLKAVKWFVWTDFYHCRKNHALSVDTITGTEMIWIAAIISTISSLSDISGSSCCEYSHYNH